ncbi:MAG: hypothetical protein ABJB69_04195 [Spartobacteria bacterium]
MALTLGAQSARGKLSISPPDESVRLADLPTQSGLASIPDGEAA